MAASWHGHTELGPVGPGLPAGWPALPVAPWECLVLPHLMGDVGPVQLPLSQALGHPRLRARPGCKRGLAPAYHPRSLDNREGGSQASLTGQDRGAW